MEEGDEVGEGVDVEVERAAEEERFHLMALLLWAGLEQGLFGLGEAAM